MAYYKEYCSKAWELQLIIFGRKKNSNHIIVPKYYTNRRKYYLAGTEKIKVIKVAFPILDKIIKTNNFICSRKHAWVKDSTHLRCATSR